MVGQDRLSGELRLERQAADGSDPLASLVRTVVTLGWLLFALFMLLTVLPTRWELSGLPVLLNLVAFPLSLGIVLCLIAGGLIAYAARASTPHRLTRAVIAVLLLTVGALQVGTATARGWWADGSPAEPGDVVVMSFNAAGLDPPAEFVAMIIDRRPAIIVLPEVTQVIAEELAEQARPVGLDYQVFNGETTSSPPSITSVMIAEGMGEYEQDRARGSLTGVVWLTPISGSGPVIVGVHPTSPERIGLSASGWRRAGRSAVDQCADNPGAIVAGDFNATVSHPQFADLGTCVDAASAVGRSGEGTWPAWMPAPFASPIDHVLVDGRSWQVIDFGTHRVGNSDHRMILSTIRPR